MNGTSEFIKLHSYALRALRREFLQFRFDYPLQTDPDAGPKESLHYYLYSDQLSWEIMSMDAAGIPRARIRLVRGYRLAPTRRRFELLQGATQIFARDVREGGVRMPLDSGAIYSELPGEGIPGIQDGFMSSLLGLYDLYVETGDAATGKLF